MKKHNPHTPILIREALDVEPKVYARYGALRPPCPRPGEHWLTRHNRVWKGEGRAIEG